MEYQESWSDPRIKKKGGKGKYAKTDTEEIREDEKTENVGF